MHKAVFHRGGWFVVTRNLTHTAVESEHVQRYSITEVHGVGLF